MVGCRARRDPLEDHVRTRSIRAATFAAGLAAALVAAIVVAAPRRVRRHRRLRPHLQLGERVRGEVHRHQQHLRHHHLVERPVRPAERQLDRQLLGRRWSAPPVSTSPPPTSPGTAPSRPARPPRFGFIVSRHRRPDQLHGQRRRLRRRRAANPRRTPAPRATCGSPAPPNTSVSLAWNASSGTVTGYRVYEGSTVRATVTGTSATISGLAAAPSHSYTVAAYNVGG